MMRCQWLLLSLVSSCLSLAVSQGEQNVQEELFMVHLPDARTMAHFQFSVTWDIHPLMFAQGFKVRHYGLFPKSLAEVVSHYKVQELHLSLTQGKWRTQIWGYPPISAPPGAELWAWFLPQSSAESEWSGLVNAMSGLLCAHLNAIGPKSTYQPLHSFKPQGVVLGNLSSSQMRYAAVPRETVCTENFTPWTKLLPCGTSAGLGSLFSALVLFDTDYHSLGLHFKPVCLDSDCARVGIELMQTLTVVFPPFISSKGYVEWTLKSLFGKVVKSSCSLASTSRVHVAEHSQASGLSFKTDPPEGTQPQRDGWISYDVADATGSEGKFDVSVKSTTKVIQAMQLYHHYQPAKDRRRPHMMELLLEVSPQTTALITVQFNRAFLKWTEHPPDAHHGFYINSAVITTVLEDCANCSVLRLSADSATNKTILRVHTEAVLVSLPTPDFSMPYNVICFVCTVIAIAFGSIFNLTTRRLEPATPENSRGILQKVISGMVGRLWKHSHKAKEPGLAGLSESTEEEHTGTAKIRSHGEQ